MYKPGMRFCPGCKNACSLDHPTCMIGAKWAAQEKKKENGANADKATDKSSETKAE